MAYYNNNFSATVNNLFPEIGVDMLKFSRKLPRMLLFIIVLFLRKCLNSLLQLVFGQM
jgi:hypothetical protein